MKTYAKAVVAALYAAITAAIPLASDGRLSLQEALMVVGAGLGALAVVYAVPNAPKEK